MSKGNQQNPDDPEEYARFVKVAEEIQDENAEELFEGALSKILTKNSKELSEADE
jgi:hypothetical protein